MCTGIPSGSKPLKRIACEHQLQEICIWDPLLGPIKLGLMVLKLTRMLFENKNFDWFRPGSIGSFLKI